MTMGTTIGFLIVAFAISALISYWLTELRKGKLIPPAEGTTMRLRAPAGMYRSKLISADPKGWKISAPLSRNHYVPLRVGEQLSIEAPVDGGVYLFKTVITARDNETHELVLQPPTHIAPRDRRDVKRCPRNEDVLVEGQTGHLVDISSLGARLKTAKRYVPGDRVRLELPEGLMYAWVLEAWPTRHGDDWRENLRVRFEATHENACV